MGTQSRTVAHHGDDPVRTYTPDEEKRIALNLAAVTAAVRSGDFKDRFPDELLLCDLHFAIFDSVRQHAGRIRREGAGTETLTFGPNRSSHRDAVPDELSTVFTELRTRIEYLDANWEAANYEDVAFRVAVVSHAEVIRIHPFEDGNGRASRLFLNVVLIRLGLKPIAFDIPKDEYRRCLNHYYRTHDAGPLIDLALRAWLE